MRDKHLNGVYDKILELDKNAAEIVEFAIADLREYEPNEGMYGTPKSVKCLYTDVVFWPSMAAHVSVRMTLRIEWADIAKPLMRHTYCAFVADYDTDGEILHKELAIDAVHDAYIEHYGACIEGERGAEGARYILHDEENGDQEWISNGPWAHRVGGWSDLDLLESLGLLAKGRPFGASM